MFNKGQEYKKKHLMLGLPYMKYNLSHKNSETVKIIDVPHFYGCVCQNV
jgi:hypothetical protein